MKPRDISNVTFGICAFNEEKNIRPLLKVVLAEKFPFPTETIVVSDGFTDETDSIVQEIALIFAIAFNGNSQRR